MVIGQSLVFKRYHEAEVTRIRLHRFKQPKVCKRIIGYDANVLYLSKTSRDMPCGKEKVVHYQNPQETAPIFTDWLKAGTWLRFWEVYIDFLNLCGWSLKRCPFPPPPPLPLSSSPYRSQTKLCLNIWKTTASAQAEKKVTGRKAVIICPALAFVCGTRGSHQSLPSHDRLSGNEDLHLVCRAGNRGSVHRGCG